MCDKGCAHPAWLMLNILQSTSSHPWDLNHQRAKDGFSGVLWGLSNQVSKC